MPFNVVDKNGKHLGYIKESHSRYTNVFKVALSEETVIESEERLNCIRDYLAGVYGCTNLLGKVQEEKWREVQHTLLKEKFPEFKDKSQRDFLKYLLLKNPPDIETLLNYKIVKDISGYILLDIDNTKVVDNALMIEEDLSYIMEEKLEGEVPLYAVVTDYPKIQIESAGVQSTMLLGGDLADLGGRHHLHSTELTIRSGNFKLKLELPMEVPAKKGTTIQIYSNFRHPSKVFYDGIIYEVK